jgi:hypothetical protein
MFLGKNYLSNLNAYHMKNKLFTSVMPVIAIAAIIAIISKAPAKPKEQNRSQQNETIDCDPSSPVSGNIIFRPFAPGAAPQAVITRKNINSLTTSEWTQLSNAYNKMKQLPASDPTSWTFQDSIHGAAPVVKNPAIGSCQHKNCFFLAWHRVYLYYFERIVRSKMTGSVASRPALPYWNSYQKKHKFNFIPIRFRATNTPLASPNGLYHSNRAALINHPTNPQSIDPAGTMSFNYGFAMSAFTNNFYVFQNRIETAHGDIHAVIGGDMATQVNAAKDPIFYSHHANIDRMWELWLRSGGSTPSRCNPTSYADAGWANKPYFFYDEYGQPVSMTGAQIINTAVTLGYKYDNAGSGSVPTKDCDNAYKSCNAFPYAATKAAARYATNTTTLINQIVTKAELIFDGNAALLNDFNPAEKTLTLEFDDIKLKNTVTDLVEIYVNPVNENNLMPEQSSFAGTLYTFGASNTSHRQHSGKTILSVNHLLENGSFAKENLAAKVLTIYFVYRSSNAKKQSITIKNTKLVLANKY